MLLKVVRSQWKTMLHAALRSMLLLIVAFAVVFGTRTRNDRPSIVRGTVSDTGDPRIDPEAIDAFVVANLARTSLPGLALAITKDNAIVYSAGYGHDSLGNALTAETPMPIGSVAKSMTAFAVMQLVEAGRIELDAPVHRYLPEFVLADPRGAQITVRHLLNQTSGMADSGFPEMDLPQPHTLNEAVVRLRTARLVAEPGTQFNYHNPNYMVAARLVEVVGGQAFDRYLDEHVFVPLVMKSSRTVDRAEQTQQLSANGYIWAYGQTMARPILPHFFNGSGGVVSTANDLARWLIVQNNHGTTAEGRQLLSAQNVAVMHTPSGVGDDYGMGWDQDILADGTKRVEHGGTPFTYSAGQAIFPESGYGFAILFNSSNAFGAEQLSFVEGLTSIIRGETPEPGLPVSVIADAIVLFLTLQVLVRA